MYCILMLISCYIYKLDKPTYEDALLCDTTRCYCLGDGASKGTLITTQEACV